jgi:hypothetical protein
LNSLHILTALRAFVLTSVLGGVLLIHLVLLAGCQISSSAALGRCINDVLDYSYSSLIKFHGILSGYYYASSPGGHACDCTETCAVGGDARNDYAAPCYHFFTTVKSGNGVPYRLAEFPRVRVLLLSTNSSQIVAPVGIRSAGDEIYHVREVAAVAVSVHESFRIVFHRLVQVWRLRIGEIGIRDGRGDGAPIGRSPAAEGWGIVAGAEVVVTGFAVAYFAFEFIRRRTSGGVRALSAEGLEVSVVTESTGRGENLARGAEEIFAVIIDSVAADDAMGDALAAEINVLVGEIAGGIGFVEDFGAGAVPVDLAAGFLEAVTVAIVSDTGGGFDFALGIPSVGIVGVVESVAGSVIAKGGDLVVLLATRMRLLSIWQPL